MGKFANLQKEIDDCARATAAALGEEYVEENNLSVGAMIGAPPLRNEPWHGQSGFEAFGHIVPPFRKSEAQEHMKKMGFNKLGDSERRHDIVEAMAGAIERDNSHEALEVAMRKGVDATGCYRLLAVLLTGEPKKD